MKPDAAFAVCCTELAVDEVSDMSSGGSSQLFTPRSLIILRLPSTSPFSRINGLLDMASSIEKNFEKYLSLVLLLVV